MTLAATFFGGINIGADTIAKQFLERQLDQIPVDVRVQSYSTSFGTLPSYWMGIRDEIASIDDVKTVEVRSQFSLWQNKTDYSSNVLVHAIMDGSVVYGDSTISGSPTLGVNETYVVQESPLATTTAVGEKLTLYVTQPFDASNRTVELTVRGIVTLGERAQRILNPYFGGVVFASIPGYFQNTLIVSWEKTLSPLLVDFCPSPPGSCQPPFQSFDVYLDRDRLINVFDVQASAANVETVVARIQNVASRERLSASSELTTVLQSFALPSFTLRVFFFIVSLPVFFISWYMGGTVSQSAYNLRRREIGMLLVKGATKGQLASIFLGEALFVGIIGGAFGLALALVLNPLFVQVFGSQLEGSPFLSQDTAIITVIFTVILTLLSVWRPARRAASLSPLDALREYVYVEEVKAYKQTWPWVAFGLGVYKIVFLLLGINFLTLGQYLGQSRSFLTSLGLLVMTFLDFVLTFIGPFLFFWGASRIFAGGSARFQAFVSRLGGRFLGDLSQVASKNVYRNPARVAAVTFLLALISGYGVWVTGQFASIEDHAVRQVYVSVGADISVTTQNTASAVSLASQLSQWPNVAGATPEITLPYNFGGQFRAIDPSGWRAVAYHEPQWFSGQVESVIFDSLESNPNTIILEKGIASQLGLSIGEFYTLSNGTDVYSMKVVGFFGPDPAQTQVFGGPVIQGFYGGWSYIPLQFWQALQSQSLGSGRVLVHVGQGSNATRLGESIRQLSSQYYVNVVEEQLSRLSSGPFGDVFQGILNVFRLGTVFAGLAASIGVGTVTYTSFREREKETTVMAVRGVSYRQLLGILLMESLPIVLFSLLLGTAVGLLNVSGNALAFNSLFQGQSFEAALAPYRLVFSTWVLLIMAVIFVSILFAVLLPALLEARKSSEKMTRMVRLG